MSAKNEEGISDELRAGIDAYERDYNALLGRPISATMPNGVVVRGTLEAGRPRDCQPTIVEADGRRYRISADEWAKIVRRAAALIEISRIGQEQEREDS